MEDDPIVTSWEKDRAVEGFMSTTQGLAAMCVYDKRARTALRKYSKFLLSEREDRDYQDLAEFLEWYGERYLLNEVSAFILNTGLELKYSTVVEFGPGTGWLIGGIASFFKNAYAVDKRAQLYRPRTNVTFIQRDLEVEALSPLPGSLVVANHFIHCVDDVPEMLKKYPSVGGWLVLEPLFGDFIFPFWGKQMMEFGATPYRWGEIIKMFDEAGYTFLASKLLRGQQVGYFEKR